MKFRKMQTKFHSFLSTESKFFLVVPKVYSFTESYSYKLINCFLREKTWIVLHEVHPKTPSVKSFLSNIADIGL